MATIGLVANIFNEANALPGWLETHLPFFDDVRVMHAGPQGEYSTDGTMEILEKWKVPVAFCSIDGGFGVVRSRTLRMSPCDWVMLLDADERFFHTHRVMTCMGESTPPSEADAILQTYDFRDLKTMIPNWENVSRLGADLRVHLGTAYNQGILLRDKVETGGYDAIVTIRRHWHDFSFKRPTQNWHTDPDWQMRLVRNHPSIFFDPSTRMHERLVGAERVIRASHEHGPFFDHFHFTFKRMEQDQRSHDVKIYDTIHRGEAPPTWNEFKK
jgi:glycosyltransferase involved in cell wall biosynthesis